MIGGLHCLLGQFSEAVINFQKVAEINPAFPDIDFNLGNALRESKNYDAAIDSYKQAILKNPKHSDSQLKFGKCNHLLQSK